MTLIIHAEDSSTDFLQPIYIDIKDKSVIKGGMTYEQVKNEIKKHDEIIMCGHGIHKGLFSMGMFSNLKEPNFIIDNSLADLLKQKQKIVTIWCYAKNYIEANDINNSFHSGMFCSEVAEAIFCGLKRLVTQKMVDESNECFAEELGKLIHLSPKEIFESMQVGEYSKLAKHNPVALFNFERLHYDFKQNIKA